MTNGSGFYTLGTLFFSDVILVYPYSLVLFRMCSDWESHSLPRLIRYTENDRKRYQKLRSDCQVYIRKKTRINEV